VQIGDAVRTIAGVRVVDPIVGFAGPPTDVQIHNGSIEAIGALPSGRQDIDGRGLFLAPGLIDAHVHLVWRGDAHPVDSYRKADDAARLDAARANARTAAYAGVTTVRDLGGPIGLLAALPLDGGADVIASGPPITRQGGHLSLFGGGCATADDARRAVDAAVESGARQVKLILSGGGLTPGTRPAEAELSDDVAEAAVRAARAAGIAVAAHCHATTAIAQACRLGVDTIEHASFLASDGTPGFDAGLARLLATEGIAVVPTASGALRTATRLRSSGTRSRDDPHAIERLEARAEFVARYRDLGVRIVAGTDAGVTDTPFDAIHEELEAYQFSGLDAAAALRTATVDAARGLGLSDRGEVRVGRRADLLLLAGDPTVALSVLRTPVAVVLAGRFVTPFEPRSDPRP
jgi:imidazolonepropionase-like amidohydrolase